METLKQREADERAARVAAEKERARVAYVQAGGDEAGIAGRSFTERQV